MREEFHGDGGGGNRKLLYGWGVLNANVWLPSMNELVGIKGIEYASTGCYFSAMQGLNTSTNPWTDINGGNQFTYFQQFNASGGGEEIMKVCNQQLCWLRSSVCTTPEHAWRITSAQQLHTPLATESHAVHPRFASDKI